MSVHAITRHHVDVNGRSVHYRGCGTGPPVLMLHASPRSSAALLPLMARAPAHVTVFAMDTPGCGDSEPIEVTEPNADDYGDALADTMTALGIDRAAVYGTHTGSAIAMTLAVRHPQRVAALVLDGLSVFNTAERAMLDDYLPPFSPQADGSHLAWLWTRVRDAHLFFPWHQRQTQTRLWRPMPTRQQLHAGAIDLLRAGDAYRAPYAAAFRFHPPACLNRLQMPTLIGARPDDVLLTHLGRLPCERDRPAHVRVETLPADDAAWAGRIWSELLRACAGLPAADAPGAPTLRRSRLGSVIVGPAGARIHCRAALGGSGRPLVLLHDSPGGARGLESEATARLHASHHAAHLCGPVIVPDWPAHGDSDDCHGLPSARALAGMLDEALKHLGIDEADIEGLGAGSLIANAWAADRPARLRAGPPIKPSASAMAAPSFEPRDDGGHLHAAWMHARDEQILGPLWTRTADTRHHFGDRIDLNRVHRLAVETLKEAPSAQHLRRSLLQEAGLPGTTFPWRDS